MGGLTIIQRDELLGCCFLYIDGLSGCQGMMCGGDEGQVLREQRYYVKAIEVVVNLRQESDIDFGIVQPSLDILTAGFA